MQTQISLQSTKMTVYKKLIDNNNNDNNDNKHLIATVQNIFNVIGREEYNIDRIVFSVSMLYSLT